MHSWFEVHPYPAGGTEPRGRKGESNFPPTRAGHCKEKQNEIVA
jgi:hypothetical protein